METLHQKFIALCHQKRKLTYELLNLLPEIYEQKVYEKHGCKTIYEYAGRYGDLPKSAVEKRLRLEPHLKDKPCLKAMIAKKGVHKVDLFARIATPKTDRALAEKVETMSKSGLEELAKELRQKATSFKTKTHNVQQLSVACKAVPQKLKIELDEQATFLFLKLKKKMGKDLSNGEVMLKILKDTQKVLPGETLRNPQNATAPKPSKSAKPSRHLTQKIRNQKIAQTAGRCAYPNCNKPFDVLHHQKRFAENRQDKTVHESIIQLCHEHHEFAHNGLIEDELHENQYWKLTLYGQKTYADTMRSLY